MMPIIKDFLEINLNQTSYTTKGIKAKARVRVEQDVDVVTKNLKLTILGQPHDEVLFASHSWFEDYTANEDRIILKDCLLFQKTNRETGIVKYYQFFIPKQLVEEALRNLHGKIKKHLRITETKIVLKQKHCYPSWWRGRSESVSCHDRIVSRIVTTNSPAHPWKCVMNKSEDHRKPCKSTWLRIGFRQVALNTLPQPLLCCPDTCLPTQHQDKMWNQSPESKKHD